MEKIEQFIHIKSIKFPVLPGEDDELVNPGMYGKALSLYVQDQLAKRDYEVPFICAEDWGWWVEIKGTSFVCGVCIYCGPGEDRSLEYACLASIKNNRVWSWKKFGFVDTSTWADKLHADLLTMFEEDSEVTVIGIAEDCPVFAEELEEDTELSSS